MPVTKPYIDGVLVSRAGNLMSLLNLSVAVDGTNPSTIDPISIGLQSISLAPATYGTIVQADLDPIPQDKVGLFQDVCEYRLLSTMYTQATALVTVHVGAQSEADWSDVAKSLKDRMALLKSDLRDNHLIGLSGLVAGTIRLNRTARIPCTAEPWPWWYY